ncbi:MAG: hypothetical protein LBF22_00050 [Deltaproteobacteria bacterium]|nr:hypothetical protein [Deltaproteobacteria bacterium]
MVFGVREEGGYPLKILQHRPHFENLLSKARGFENTVRDSQEIVRDSQEHPPDSSLL